jgi:multiple sugar transport system permease protein
MFRHRKRHKALHDPSQRLLRNVAVFSMLVFFLLFFVFPIIMAFVGSFYHWNPLRQQSSFTGIANWRRLFNSQLFWHSAKNTLLFAGVAVVCRVLLGLVISQALYSKLTRCKSLYRLLYYLPTVTPIVAVAFVWKFIFDPRIGILNNLLNLQVNWLFDGKYALVAILIFTIWKDFGYAVVMLLGSLYSLPKDCYEAAEIDGANAWQRFRHLTIHFLKPTILFIVVVSLISYFQAYIPVLVLTQGGPGTQTYLATYLIYQEAFTKYNFGYASALSFVLFIFIALLTAISFKISGAEGSF